MSSFTYSRCSCIRWFESLAVLNPGPGWFAEKTVHIHTNGPESVAESGQMWRASFVLSMKAGLPRLDSTQKGEHAT